MIKKENIEKRLSDLADGEKCEITKIVPLKGNANLVLFICNDELDCSCVVYNGGELFHLSDWQGGYPENADEVEDYQWLTEDGRDAVVMNGLPRIF
jgi:hypothetical protein